MSPLISRKRWCLPLLRASSVHADCLCSWALCSWRSCWILRSFQKGAEFHRFIHLKFTCLFKVTHLLKARNFLIWHQWKYQMFTSRTETPERGTQNQWGEGFHATNGEGGNRGLLHQPYFFFKPSSDSFNNSQIKTAWWEFFSNTENKSTIQREHCHH